jgi:pimeloyl-ACP methyl ester carboxylesterase
MPYADLPGVRLWFTDSGGSGVPMVLMHPASGTTESWFQQVPVFSQAGYRVITYDRRGWGKSTPAAGGEQPGCASDDLLALVDHLGLDRFHLVGSAAGAAPAVDFAISYPERLRSLVVADCTGGVQDPDHLEILERARPPEFLALPTHLRELSASYRGTNVEGTQRFIEIEETNGHATAPRQKARNHITYALLEKMTVPTLAIAGDADASTPPAIMHRIADHIPGCRYEAVLEAGHGAFWERPDVWNKLVLDFVAQH